MKAFSKIILSMIMLISIVAPIQVSASEEVHLKFLWDAEVDADKNYAWGENPSIALYQNLNLVIAIKERHGMLAYQLGEFYEGDGKMYWTKPVDFVEGSNPSVTKLSTNQMMLVYKDGNGKLATSIAGFFNLTKGELSWRHEGSYDTGSKPSITTLTSGDRLEVHQGGINNLYANLAKGWNHDSSSWVSIGSKYDNGVTPNITSLNDNKAFETHKSEWNDEIWYRILSVNDDDRINWTSSTKIGNKGKDPVSLQLENDLILTMWHDGNKTWHKTGELKGEKIEWGVTVNEYDGKRSDVLQLHNGLLLNVHEDPYSDNLVYLLGRWKEEEGSSHRVVWWK